MSQDVNKTFTRFAVFLLAGGLATIPAMGFGGLLLALFMCYFMLICTNAIRSGEIRKRNQR
jgi:hypothetical protein